MQKGSIYAGCRGKMKLQAKTVGLRKRGQGDLGAVAVEQFVADITAEIKERRA